MSAAWIAGEVTTIAFCWRIERADGVALGFTGHDRDLAFGGMVYRAAPGMMPSAVARGAGFAVDTIDVAGALTGDAISAADLAAGRWDGAAVRLYAIDWADPGAVPLLLARGTLGDIERRDGAFTAELKGAASVLDRPAAEVTTPDCRAALGDRRCGVDMAGRRRIVSVSPGAGDERLVADAAEPSPNAYGYGRLRWVTGPDSGLAAEILSSDGHDIILRAAPVRAVAAGTLAEVTEGCDRLHATCRDRFANAANFRGEPWLPGNDLLTRYPGG